MEMVEVLNHFKAQLNNECPKKVGMMAKAINQPQMSIEYGKNASPLIRLYKSKVMELIPYTKNVYIISDNLLRNCCPNKKYPVTRSEEHTSELQSRFDLVCRLLLEKKKTRRYNHL